MLWDQLFGTYLYKKRENIDFIGIKEHMPAKLIDQLKMPFVWKKFQSEPDPETELYC